MPSFNALSALSQGRCLSKMKEGGRLRTMIVVMKDKPSSYLDIFGAALLSYVVEMVDELGQCQYHTSFITLSTI